MEDTLLEVLKEFSETVKQKDTPLESLPVKTTIFPEVTAVVDDSIIDWYAKRTSTLSFMFRGVKDMYMYIVWSQNIIYKDGIVY